MTHARTHDPNPALTYAQRCALEDAYGLLLVAARVYVMNGDRYMARLYAGRCRTLIAQFAVRLAEAVRWTAGAGV